MSSADAIVVSFLSSTGDGLLKPLALEPGEQTLGDVLATQYGHECAPSGYVVRVRRQDICMGGKGQDALGASFPLQDGDRVQVTPDKVKGE